MSLHHYSQHKQKSYAKVLPGVGSREFRGGFPEESSGTIPCPTWIVPVNTKMAPSLSRGEQSISPASSAFGKIYIRKSKKHLILILREESEKYVTATSLQAPRSVQKKREGVIQIVEQGEDHGEADVNSSQQIFTPCLNHQKNTVGV